MATSFTPGQVLGRGDLDIFLTNLAGNPTNPVEIAYALYYIDPLTHLEVLIGNPARVPVNPQVGEFYAAVMVPPTAVAGNYRIRWTIREFSSSPQQQVVQEWTVVGDATALAVIYTPQEQRLIDNLRMLLRDQNPDKFYHFRPPEHESRIGTFDRIFGQIWEDAELYLYLNQALGWFNMFPPASYSLSSLQGLATQKPEWVSAVTWMAVVYACFAVQANWAADEFDYSIGGVSLTLNKTSLYDTLRSAAEAQFDKATQAKKDTTLFIRGLQQPKYGIGIRSAFGPHVGQGILSPRNFL